MEEIVINHQVSDFICLLQSSYQLTKFSELEKYEKIKQLLNSSITFVNNKLIELRNKDNLLSVTHNQDDVIVEVDNIQCFEPRGRFKIILTSSNLLLQGKQFNVVVPVKNIIELIVVPSYASLKKEGEDYVALHLNESVKINNKESKHVLLNLLKSFNTTTKSKYSNHYNDFTESTVITMGLHEVSNLSITRPQSSLFNSIRDSKPYLKCHRGIQEGAIYPLHSGVVFMKPFLLIPSNEISSIAAGRGGNSSNTRYVDVVIETIHDDKVYEFTNIDREELPALQSYIKDYLEEMAKKKIKMEKKLQKHRAEEIIILNDNNDDNNIKSKTNKTTMETSSIVYDMTMENPSASNKVVPSFIDIDHSDDDSDDSDDDDYDPDASESDTNHHHHKKRKYNSDDSDSNDDDNSDDSDSDNSDSDDGSNTGSSPRKHTNNQRKLAKSTNKNTVPHMNAKTLSKKKSKLTKGASNQENYKSKKVDDNDDVEVVIDLSKEQQQQQQPVLSNGTNGDMIKKSRKSSQPLKLMKNATNNSHIKTTAISYSKSIPMKEATIVKEAIDISNTACKSDTMIDISKNDIRNNNSNNFVDMTKSSIIILDTNTTTMKESIVQQHPIHSKEPINADTKQYNVNENDISILATAKQMESTEPSSIDTNITAKATVDLTASLTSTTTTTTTDPIVATNHIKPQPLATATTDKPSVVGKSMSIMDAFLKQSRK